MLKPIEIRHLTDETTRRIKEQITNGSWRAGERIPSEHKLCETLGVSRVTVRNAIHRLMGVGLLETRHGDGTFVTDLSPAIAVQLLTPSFLLGEHSVREVLEFRAVIEVGSAALAAANATEQDLAMLQDLVQKMRAGQNNYRAYARWDLQFHRQLASASHNAMIVKVEELLGDMLETTFSTILKATGRPLEIERHEVIVRHVANGDAQAARTETQLLMDRFMENVRKEIDSIEDHLRKRARSKKRPARHC